MKPVRHYLHVLWRNPHYKLASFALAVFAWVYVQEGEIHETHVTARVDWFLPEGLVAARSLPSVVVMRVRGTRTATRKAGERGVVIPVDLSAAGLGEHSVDFASYAADLPQGIALLSTSPSSELALLDEVASRKVRIEPTLIGEPAGGYAVDVALTEPSVVEVEGARMTVEKLESVATEAIDVSNLSRDLVTQVKLDLPRLVRATTEVLPEATVRVTPLLERRILGAVPVLVWQQYGWVPQQETVEVTVEGPAGALREAGPDTVIAVVHLPDTPERDKYEASFGPNEGVRLRVVHPRGDQVKIVKVVPDVVEVQRK